MSTRTPHDKSGQQEGFGSLLSCVVRWALLCVVTRLGWFGIMPINSLYLHFDRLEWVLLGFWPRKENP